MGCFSWMFADTDNKEALRIGDKAHLFLPTGVVLTEPSYDGHGRFDGQDVYDLVADWNRVFLAANPDFIIKQVEEVFNSEAGEWVPKPDKKVNEFPWYPAYADLAKSRAEVVEAVRELDLGGGRGEWRTFRYRCIGIEIACYNEQNAALPYPIKICRTKRGRNYETLPPSEADPDQGMGRKWRW